VDEGVGAIVDALRARGELDQTLFVFTSDSGFFQGEHRVPRGKFKVYEPSVRVPALMRGPGVPVDERVSQLTSNVDFAATIVDAAGAERGRILDGVSLRELAQRPSSLRPAGDLTRDRPRGRKREPPVLGDPDPALQVRRVCDRRA
jgi:N-acetylglucosamine-6-sulfatase